MKNIKLLILAVVASISLTSCNEEVETLNTNYITFSKDSYSTSVESGSTTTYDVTIYTANLSSADRTFNVSVDMDATNADNASYTVPTTVTIPANQNEGTLPVLLSDVNLGIGLNTLVLNFDAVDGLSNGGSATINYIQECTEVTATLDIVFDGYGSETSWEVTDSLGGVVASAVTGTYSDGLVSVSVPITLCGGRDFTFTINDSFGDGLSFPSNGTYSLTIGGVIKASGGGDFGSSESTNFDTN